MRSFSTLAHGADSDGGEKLGVSVFPRRGASLSGLQVRFREERPGGTAAVIDCRLDQLGLGEINLPEQCVSAGMELLSDRHGILGIAAPARFWRNPQVRTGIIAPSGNLDAPARKQTGNSRYRFRSTDHAAQSERCNHVPVKTLNPKLRCTARCTAGSDSSQSPPSAPDSHSSWDRSACG